MTVSKRDIQILIGFIGVAIAALVYFFIFRPKTQATEALANENITLNSRVQELEAIYDQWSFFEEETDKMSNEVDEMVAHFPADVLEEDVIYQGIQFENESMVTLDSLGISEAELLYSPIGYSVDMMNEGLEYTPEFDIYWDDFDAEGIGAFFGQFFLSGSDNYADVTEVTPEDTATLDETAEALGDGTEETADAVPGDPNAEGEAGSGINMLRKTANYEMTTDLEEFLRCLECINRSYNRDVIQDVSLDFDSSTGMLRGSMTLNKYYMAGTGKVYDAPDFSNVVVGTSDLFTILKKKKAD